MKLRKLLAVARYEFVNMVTRKSYLLTTFILPGIFLLVGIIAAVVIYTSQKNKDPARRNVCVVLDESGLFTDAKEDSSFEYTAVGGTGAFKGLFSAFRRRSMFGTKCDVKVYARIEDAIGDKASKNGFVRIPADFAKKYEIVLMVNEEYHRYTVPVPSKNWFLTPLLKNKLSEREINIVRNDPAVRDVQLIAGKDVARTSTSDEHRKIAEKFTAQLAAALFLFGLFASFGILVTGMEEEKESKVLELMLTTIDAERFLGGKLMGLCLAALLQSFVWTFCLFLPVLVAGLSMILVPAVFFYSIMIFFLGFMFFGSLFLGVGAVPESVKDSQQMVAILTLFPLSPIMFLHFILGDPNSILVNFLTFFPMTAPVTILIRMALGALPVGIKIAAPVVLALSVFGSLYLSSRLLKASVQLKGTRIGVFGFIKYLFSR